MVEKRVLMNCDNCGGKKLPYPQGCNYCKHYANWIPLEEEEEKKEDTPVE